MLSKLLCVIFLIFSISSNVVHYHYYYGSQNMQETNHEHRSLNTHLETFE